MTQYILKTPSPRVEGAVFYDRSDAISHNPGRGSITTSTIGNHMTAIQPGPSFPAPFYVKDLEVTAVSGSTLVCENLDYFDSYAAGLYLGAQITNSRLVAGVMTEIETNFVSEAIVRSIAMLSDDGQVIETGQFRWSPPNSYRGGATEYLGVAEIGADGAIGPFAIASYILSAQPSKQSVSNASVSGPSYTGQRDTSLSAPSDVLLTTEDDGLTALLSWTHEIGKQYVVFRSSYPEFDTVSELRLGNLLPDIQADDLIVVKARIDHTKAKSDIMTNRAWGVGDLQKQLGIIGLARFNEDLAEGTFRFEEDTDGSPYVRLEVLAGETMTLQAFTHTGSGGLDNSFYPAIVPNRVYNLTLTARATGTGSLQAEMANVESYKPVTGIGASFSDVVTSFSTPTLPTTSAARPTRLQITGPLQLDLKMFAVNDDSADPMYWTPDDLTELAAAQPRFTRLHFSVKSKPWSFDVKTMIRSVGTRYSYLNGLHRSLENLATANNHNGGLHEPTSPWIQVPWHFSDAEHRFLMGYYYTSAPADTDTSQEAEGARLRMALGKAEPWVTAFQEIMWEVENENWNGLSTFYSLPSVSGEPGGAINGKMLDRLADIAMATPNYDVSKTKYYLGLWSKGQSGWNPNSIANSVHADFAGPADYTGGWDLGVGQAGSLERLGDIAGLAANDYTVERAEKAIYFAQLCEDASVDRAKPLLAMPYEAGPGYQINGLNGGTVTVEEQRAQEAFSKGWVGGTAVLSAFLLNASKGLVSQNFFTFGAGDYFNSHTVEKFGGAASGAWMWFTFMQQHLIGAVTQLYTEHFDRYANYAPAENRSACSAFKVEKQDGSLRYAFVNHDFENNHTISVFVKDELPTHVRLARMSGDIQTSNTTVETRDALTIDITERADLVDGSKISVELAPGECVVVMLDDSQG